MFLIYGLLAYVGFHASFLYLVGFVADRFVPRTVASGGASTGTAMAIAIDVLLIAAFGLQHALMARPAFKRRWSRVVPRALERSTFVMASVGALLLLCWQWRPLPMVVWHCDGIVAYVLTGVFSIGWVVAMLATFAIDHFELLGVRQSAAAFAGRDARLPAFHESGLDAVVRYPLVVGLLTAFWSVPRMTLGGLVFASAFSAFVVVSQLIRERHPTVAIVAAGPARLPSNTGS